VLPAARVLGAATPVAGFPWPPARRQPLPALPPVTAEQGDRIVWASAAYQSILPFTPPAVPDPGFYRGNFCGVRVSGIVQRPEMAGYTLPGGDKTLVMDLDLFKYRGDVAAQEQIFQAHVDRGYTHFQFSLGDAWEHGWLLREFSDLLTRWRAHGGYTDVWVLGSYGLNDRDAMWATFGPRVTPWLEPLCDDALIDCCCLGWQLDGWLSGTALVDNLIGLGDLIRDRVKFYAAHWVRDANAWWDDATAKKYGISDRFAFWRFQKEHGYLNRTHMQVDVNAPVSALDQNGQPTSGIQGAIRDVKKALQPGQKIVWAEYQAQSAFDNPSRVTEGDGDLSGFLGLCAGCDGGYYGGARRIDGSHV
jgi:hypothetical protein